MQYLARVNITLALCSVMLLAFFNIQWYPSITKEGNLYLIESVREFNKSASLQGYALIPKQLLIFKSSAAENYTYLQQNIIYAQGEEEQNTVIVENIRAVNR